MKFIYKENIQSEYCSPFQYRAKTYCAICSRRSKWVEVMVLAQSGDFIFRCHNDEQRTPVKEFCDTKQINGPWACSFIAFDKNGSE